jgi:hypothetical protein
MGEKELVDGEGWISDESDFYGEPLLKVSPDHL